MIAFVVLAAIVFLRPDSALACAACYGQSDSPLAAGMNWGIMSLLGFIGCVLGAVAGFFVYIVRRSNRMAPAPEQEHELAMEVS